MRPVIERTPVTAQCISGHQWNTEILPGSTMPQTADCPTCGGTVSFYPSLKEAYNNRRNKARRERDQIRRDCGLVRVRGALGGVYWE